MQLRSICAGAALAMFAAGAAHAGTAATITIDGDFADWAGIPVLANDPMGDATPIDVATVQLADDADNLYLRVTYHTPVNPNRGPSLFLAFDTDNNVATGFNIYGLNRVGSEAAFQNDFPFEQRTGFNSGPLNKPAIIAPVDFADASSLFTAQEYSIPRDVGYTRAPFGPVFSQSFTLLVWSDEPSAEATDGIPYTFATAVPEPMSLAALAAASLMAGRRRRMA